MSRSSLVSGRSPRWNWIHAAVLAMAAGTVVFAAVGGLPTTTNRPMHSKLRQPGGLDTRLLGLMGELGMDASALTVAGLTADEARTTTLQLKEFLVERGTDWDQVLADHAAAQSNLHHAQRLKASGRAAQVDTDIASLETQLSNARQSRSALLAAAHEVAPLTPEQRSLMGTIKVNRHWPVPIEYMGSVRSEQEWVSLMARLASRTASGGPSTDVDDAQTQALRQRLGNKELVEAAVLAVARQ